MRLAYRPPSSQRCAAPVINAGGAPALAQYGGRGAPGLSQNITPILTPLRLSPFDSTYAADVPSGRRAGGVGGGGAGGGGGRGGIGGAPDGPRSRVVLQFPANANDMLLSGTLNGGQALAGRAQLFDAPIGKGHVVMFGIPPFWRW